MPFIVVFLLFSFVIAQDAPAQSPVANITLASDQIGVVRTAQGITTRISFPEEVEEIICGDLYDSASGKGSFVAQRSGNDVFLKPIPSKGMSNLFVKTRGKRTYNFDLMIVSIPQSHRVVNVIDQKPGAVYLSAHNPQASSSPPPNGDSLAGGVETSKTPQEPAPRKPDTQQASREAEAILTSARQRADDLVSAGRQQSERMVSEAETKIAEAERLSDERASQQAEQRFVQALILGLRESKIDNPKLIIKKIVIMLDPRVLIFNDKSYVRYRLHNTGDSPFTFGSVTLEAGASAELTPISIKLVQSKNENRLESGESLTGIIAFDPKQVTTGSRLFLCLRAEDKAEIGRLTIQ